MILPMEVVITVDAVMVIVTSIAMLQVMMKRKVIIKNISILIMMPTIIMVMKTPTCTACSYMC